ncbi:MAG: ankyrin repeat domain-containing protein [Gemmatimonadaceae bacterium]|nr:ankyrin repeat domain-containing protein [Gemmatimonadaceae bacterium]
MAESSDSPTPAPGAPSDFLMALYMGDRDKAKALAESLTLTLPELAALGDLPHVARHVTHTSADLQAYSGDGWTALHLAAFFGYASVVVVLLRAGANHSASSHNAQGNTALHAALAGRCEMTVIAALLAAGSSAAVADIQGYTPLHLAASRGDRAASELLLACGAERDARTPDGKSPSDIALERGHVDLAEWLSRP